jgi:hypothetical protein
MSPKGSATDSATVLNSVAKPTETKGFFATPTGIEEPPANAPIVGDSAVVALFERGTAGETVRDSRGFAPGSSGVAEPNPKPADVYASLIRTRELAAVSGEWDFVAKVQAEIDALRLERAGGNVVAFPKRKAGA